MNSNNFLNITLTKKIYTIEEIQELTKYIFKNYNIKEAYIFGSYARGEARMDSDIDIIIKKDDSFSLLQLSALANDLTQILRKEIDLITEETYTDDIKYDNKETKEVKKRFYNIIKKEKKKIYAEL